MKDDLTMYGKDKVLVAKRSFFTSGELNLWRDRLVQYMPLPRYVIDKTYRVVKGDGWTEHRWIVQVYMPVKLTPDEAMTLMAEDAVAKWANAGFSINECMEYIETLKKGNV